MISTNVKYYKNKKLPQNNLVPKTHKTPDIIKKSPHILAIRHVSETRTKSR